VVSLSLHNLIDLIDVSTTLAILLQKMIKTSKRKGAVDQVDGVEGMVEEDIVENDDFEDQLESAYQQGRSNVWFASGPQKNAAIRILIQCFGSMVEAVAKDGAVPDHRGRYRQEDMQFHKLLDAAKQVVKAKRSVFP
jgi:hypothetical protein